jgi:glycosyltransferase involved in cell wall biosynthesis
MKKKVLFVGSFLEMASDGSVGGQMYACKSLLKSRLSDEIDWLLLDSTGKSVPPPPIYERLFTSISRCFKFVYLLLFFSPSSVLIFSANGPSVYEKGCMIILAKLLGRNTVFAPRGGALIDEIANNKAKRFFFKLVAKCSNHIICQGVFWKVYFNSLLGVKFQKKLVVINNWIDYQLYQFPLKSLPIRNNEEVNILFMGWMQVEKGVHDLFDALLQLECGSKKINMYFLGDGDQREYLQIRAALESQNKQIQFYFPGWIYGSKKMTYLQLADIFVLPSYSEGMPNSLIEAMASGVAPISTNVGSVPELIDDHVNGFMFQPKDKSALTCALTHLIINPELRNIFAIKSKEKICRHHSLNCAVASFKKIL